LQFVKEFHYQNSLQIFLRGPLKKPKSTCWLDSSQTKSRINTFQTLTWHIPHSDSMSIFCGLSWALNLWSTFWYS
jgi:hypothetical protein